MYRIAGGQFVQDPIYDVAKKMIAFDGDTQDKIINYHSGNNSNDATHGLEGKTSDWQVQRQAGTMFRINNCGLRVRWKFATTPAGAAACTNRAPSWNLFAKKVRGLRFGANDSSTYLYNSASGHYPEEFTARCYKYSKAELNSMDNALFTPCFDKRYTATATGTTIRGSNTVSSAMEHSVGDIAVSGDVIATLTDESAAATPTKAEFNALVAGINTHNHEVSIPEKSGRVERMEKWIGVNSHQRIVTQII